MKVVKVDNFDRGLTPDELVMGNLTEELAEELANRLNSELHNTSDYFHLVVKDDYPVPTEKEFYEELYGVEL